MKNALFFLLLLLAACTKDLDPVFKSPSIPINSASIRFLELTTDYRANMSTRNAFTENPPRGFNGFQLKFFKAFNEAKESNKSWEEVDVFVMAQYKAIIGENKEITEAEKLNTSEIQYVSLSYLSDFLMKQPLSQKTADRIIYHLNILHKHQNNDLKDLADALIHVKNYMSDQNYYEIKSYVIAEADKNTLYVKENYKQAEQNYKNVDESEKFSYLTTGYHLSSISKEANYVRELLEG